MGRGGGRGAAARPRQRATLIDHVVLATPDLARTEAALAGLGLERRRLREAGDLLQAFYRLGPVILEVVARVGEAGDGPASLWGFTVVVEDLDALAARLGDRLGRVTDAVQPGRRIATVRREAGLGVPLAFMSP
jgi:predicted RNA-binding protein with TRAM domain